MIDYSRDELLAIKDLYEFSNKGKYFSHANVTGLKCSCTHSDSNQMAIQTVITPHQKRVTAHHHLQQQSLHRPERDSYMVNVKCNPIVRKSSHTTATLPRVFYSNVRLITNAKHTELLQQSVEYDIIMVSESWLKLHKRQAFSIPEFNLINGERSEKRPVVYVCTYVIFYLQQWSTNTPR